MDERPQSAARGSEGRNDPPETLADETPHSDPLSEAILPPGTMIGRYHVLERIGAGGMGVVYAAYDPELDRKVALKLLRPGDDDDERATLGRARLLREAQALAKLTHPNVVTVHDAGTFESRVFVAMEFVEGATLRRWLSARERRWPEIVAMFIQAGRGLAAAHTAGMIHRDFKPDNVLIGTDGRARVVDFGLARRTDAPGEPAQPEEAMPSASVSMRTGELSARLTVTGAIAGTPAYMAPEQHRGTAADHRTDQFGFCVALWEALYGVRPFAGNSRISLVYNVCQGTIRDPPADAEVPAFMRGILTRGLSVRQEDRHPSMDALLDELERDPTRARRRTLTLAGGALLMVGATGAVATWREDAPDPCAAGPSRLAGIWDQQRRNEIRDAFEQTGKAYVDDAWRTVSAMLDAHAEEWAVAHREACEAHHVRNEQSAELFDLRMACLQGRLDELGAVTEILATADETVVAKAVQSAAGLQTIDTCADADALLSGVMPPADVETRERVEALRRDLARAYALGLAGKYEEGGVLAEQVHEKAQAIGYTPLMAECASSLGDLKAALGDDATGEKLLTDAVLLALEARHDRALARAMTRLVSVVGVGLSRYDDGLLWGRQAEAVISRIEKDGPMAATLSRGICMMLADKGDPTAAMPYCKRGLSLAKSLYGAEHIDAAKAHSALGNARLMARHYAEAEAEFRRSLEIHEGLQGPGHPDVASLLNSLAAVCYYVEGAASCVDHFEKAVDATILGFGEDHPNVADFTNNLALALLDAGRLDEAEAKANASLRIRRAASGENHPGVGAAQLALGSVAQARGDLQGARVKMEAALENFVATRGHGHPNVVEAATRLTDVLVALGDATGAIERARDVLSQAEAHGRTAEELATLREALERARSSTPNSSG